MEMVGSDHIPRVDVLGVGVSAVDLQAAVRELGRWIDEGAHHYVCVTGVHSVMESQADPELRAIHNGSGLTVPDGMPMVWAGHWAGFKDMSRVPGPDLMPAAFAAGVAPGWKHFLYGGAEGVTELLAARLAERVPGAEIVGTYCPPFRALTETEEDEVVAMLNESGADIVWVGLGAPKQERWMHRMMPRLTAHAVLGVGAAFDFNAGLLPRAPRFMQRLGLEWLYRLLREPRRLARRYLGNNPRFIFNIIRRPPRPMEQAID
jgi:N-acetylglucosaminyldiphosphoundecaprenol N-acetyl-beta-D-mannosaminyltransferase